MLIFKNLIFFYTRLRINIKQKMNLPTKSVINICKQQIIDPWNYYWNKKEITLGNFVYEQLKKLSSDDISNIEIAQIECFLKCVIENHSFKFEETDYNCKLLANLYVKNYKFILDMTLNIKDDPTTLSVLENNNDIPMVKELFKFFQGDNNYFNKRILHEIILILIKDKNHSTCNIKYVIIKKFLKEYKIDFEPDINLRYYNYEIFLIIIDNFADHINLIKVIDILIYSDNIESFIKALNEKKMLKKNLVSKYLERILSLFATSKVLCENLMKFISIIHSINPEWIEIEYLEIINKLEYDDLEKIWKFCQTMNIKIIDDDSLNLKEKILFIRKEYNSENFKEIKSILNVFDILFIIKNKNCKLLSDFLNEFDINLNCQDNYYIKKINYYLDKQIKEIILKNQSVTKKMLMLLTKHGLDPNIIFENNINLSSDEILNLISTSKIPIKGCNIIKHFPDFFNGNYQKGNKISLFKLAKRFEKKKITSLKHLCINKIFYYEKKTRFGINFALNPVIYEQMDGEFIFINCPKCSKIKICMKDLLCEECKRLFLDKFYKLLDQDPGKKLAYKKYNMCF